MRKCTNCLKAYEDGEKCGGCGNTLGTKFFCAKIGTDSAHFCSKRCANSVIAAASYQVDLPPAKGPSGGYECRKCGYRFVPDDLEINPKVCPDCTSPNLEGL